MTTNNLMKYKKHLSAVMTFNYWIFFLISALLTGCSSSNAIMKNRLRIILQLIFPTLKELGM